MNDDQMDEMLIQGVRDYNSPGAVPREEMWAAISEARSAKSEGRTAKSPIAGHGSPIGNRSSLFALRPSRFALAAGLLLAAGIVIGRRIERSAPAATTPGTQGKSVAVLPKDSVKSAPTTTDSLINELHEETKKTDRQVRALAQAAPRTDSRRPSAERNLAYQLVVLKHLAGSEAMITSFRAGARSGEMDAQISAWSRELLSTTRLLESSEVTSDPVMKRLLEDLDLVISQIVQYSSHGTTNPDELDLIEQSIKKRDVMSEIHRGVLSTRLRTPDRSASGT